MSDTNLNKELCIDDENPEDANSAQINSNEEVKSDKVESSELSLDIENIVNLPVSDNHIAESISDEEIDTTIFDKKFSETNTSNNNEQRLASQKNEVSTIEAISSATVPQCVNKKEITKCSKCEKIELEFEQKAEDLNNSLLLLNSKVVKKEEDIELWKKKYDEKVTESKAAMTKLQTEMNARLEKALRMLEAVKNEKEAAVMKYVIVEQDIATKEKAIEVSEKRRSNLEKDLRESTEKTKQAIAERTKMRHLLESKENDVIMSRKECDKIKCEMATVLQKLKGAENRLQKETEAHAETQSKVSFLNQKFKETREELDSARKQCQDLVKLYRNMDLERRVVNEAANHHNNNNSTIPNDESSTNGSESDLSSIDDSGSLSGHAVPNNDEAAASNLIKTCNIGVVGGKINEFEFMRKMQNNAMLEITSLRDKLSQCRKEMSAIQQCMREKSDELMVKDAELSAMRSRIDAYVVLENEVESEKTKRQQIEETRMREQALVDECEQRISDYQRREQTNLEYTTKLTNKITDLQLELQQKSAEVGELKNEIGKMREEMRVLKEVLESESKLEKTKSEAERLKDAQIESLLKSLQEKDAAFNDLVNEFEERKNEWKIERRKIESSTKDLSRQLQSMKKSKESIESEFKSALVEKKKCSQSSITKSGTKNGPLSEESSVADSFDLLNDVHSVDEEDLLGLDSFEDAKNVRRHEHNSLGDVSSKAKAEKKEAVHSTAAKLDQMGNRQKMTGHNSKTTLSQTTASDQHTFATNCSNNLNGSTNADNVSSSMACTSVQIAQPFKRTLASRQDDYSATIATSAPWFDKYPGLDKNMVVEKLIKIQKQHKRFMEKNDLLEDQVTHLTADVQKKNKVIQYYVLREETGTLAPVGNDTILFNKLYSQKFALTCPPPPSLSSHSSSAQHQLVKYDPHGSDQHYQEHHCNSSLSKLSSSVSSSLKLSSLFPTSSSSHSTYTSSADISEKLRIDQLNLRFYKELNTRLQSVLEDTILKNIKLQENLDKMSLEIESLKHGMEGGGSSSNVTSKTNHSNSIVSQSSNASSKELPDFFSVR